MTALGCVIFLEFTGKMFMFPNLRPELSPLTFPSVRAGGLTWSNAQCHFISWNWFWRDLPLWFNLLGWKFPHGGLGYSLWYIASALSRMCLFRVSGLRNVALGRSPCGCGISARDSGDGSFASGVVLGWLCGPSALTPPRGLLCSPLKKAHFRAPSSMHWTMGSIQCTEDAFWEVCLCQ